jgi:DNA-binding MarR family transcriptional regulator
MHDLAALTLPMMWTLRQASVRALEPLGLRPSQGLVLGIVAQGVDSPKAIADLLDLSPPMLSGLLGDLEERGLIVRSPHPEDRRRVLLAPSDEGRAATERITLRWTDVMRERLGHLDDDDLTVLLRIYRRFVGEP